MKDIDIRNSLKESILMKYINDSESLVIDEFNISLGTVRADVAVVNGVLHGYEIKSEKDTLKRLENQICEYNKFFEFVTIVTCEKFSEKVLFSLPEKCGVIIAQNKKGKIIFKHIRKAKKNKDLDKITLAKALWKDEITDILEKINYKKGFKSKSKPFLYEILSEQFTEKELVEIVKRKIKDRINWRVDSQRTQNGDYFQLSSKL